MKLHEKILYCRKKAGLTQEALAEQIGVSRQAISKWETGDAVPEINKLPLLANAFHVTADWLLSEEEPETDPPESGPGARQKDRAENTASFIDSLPGVIKKLIGQYGWLYGVYIALGGVGFVVIGVLANALFSTSSQAFSPYGSSAMDLYGLVVYDQSGNIISGSTSGGQGTAFGTALLVIGIIIVLAGAALAIYLKSRTDD